MLYVAFYYPFAVTRSDIDFYNFGDEQLDKMMLMDSISCHRIFLCQASEASPPAQFSLRHFDRYSQNKTVSTMPLRMLVKLIAHQIPSMPRLVEERR